MQHQSICQHSGYLFVDTPFLIDDENRGKNVYNNGTI